MGSGRPVPAGLPRRQPALARRLAAAARASLQVVRGDPVRRVALAAKAVGAERVHVAADYGPYGSSRDREVERALEDAGVELVRTGSPYAVAPGRVTKGDGSPYRVFTPFSRAWTDHGWRGPVDAPTGRCVAGSRSTTRPTSPSRRCPTASTCPRPASARRCERWHEFLDGPIDDYEADRDKPGVDGTSRMSVHLKWGEIHPRTMLADLAGRRGAGPTTYRTELCWREFYADVLWHNPASARDYYRPEFARDGLRRARRAPSPPGSAAAPATPSSTPGCASCARPAGCTTGSG